MLIYNHKKEFLGMDEFDLQALGFRDLAHLQTEVSDFSDLFVKTPGCIHNFKHVHWIDFITCADSTEPPKVIIHTLGVNYKCHLKITTAYLSDNPTAKAYIILLQNLRRLTDSESSSALSDIAHKQKQSAPYTPPTESFNHFETAQAETLEPEFKETKLVLDETVTQSNVIEDEYDNLPLEIDIEEDYEPAVERKNEPPKTPELAAVPKVETPKEKAVTKSVHHILEVSQEQEYIFDPNVASKELGLPVDLIEEFIQDFIEQAKEFKDELYTSLHDLDLTNVKILSHKLKGVAANLRVADALEALTVVNTSVDFPTIHSSLDRFYRIISKLSGEAPESFANTVNTRSDEDEFVVNFKDESEDEFVLDFKNEDEFTVPAELNIDDNDVPNIIEMPELADDDFSPTQIKDVSPDLLDIDFDTVDANELFLEVADIDELPDVLDVIEDTDTLELLHIAEEKNIKPVTLLQTPEKPNIKIDYKPEVIANEIGIDIESFLELFDDFLDEGQVKCTQIKTAINDGNSDLWKVKAIKLKGMSENMRIKELSYELDTIIRTSDSNVALDSINKIDAIMSQISLKGA